jgi:low affinity Fe/Cu permease
MNPFQTVIFLLFTLPALIIREGWDMLVDHLKKEKKDWQLPYLIAMAVCILLIIILLFILF